ncbi:hypothetical protein PABY_10930 [Pyrodictium abyssi]|uniref:Uncharacterized protein n=1 Tax=Pyrodictium abyssi TaxID=54256 RepID=A0ABM8IVE6_9CREN|nr:hypothetical protein PABY_10930 [Pyrodictium abyssi]
MAAVLLALMAGLYMVLGYVASKRAVAAALAGPACRRVRVLEGLGQLFDEGGSRRDRFHAEGLPKGKAGYLEVVEDLYPGEAPSSHERAC